MYRKNNEALKKYLIVAALALGAIACGTTDEAKTTTAEPKKETSDLSSNPDYQKGLALIAGSDCLTCHTVNDKLIGPSYKSIADKYENNAENITLLAKKVIKGGQGVWGQVPMTPHPKLSEEDAAQMVKYVLLLKTK